jgi:hypothetical protein
VISWFKKSQPDGKVGEKQVQTHKRRSAFREEKVVTALAVPSSGGAFEIRTRDLSIRGLSFECPRALIDNEKVVIKFTTDETRNVVYTVMIRCRVSWVHLMKGASKKILVGVEFEPMSVVENLGLIRFFLEHYGLHFLDPTEKRRNVRLAPKVSIPMEFLDQTGERIMVYLKDIGLEGLGFVAERPLEVGQTLTLFLRTGEDVWIDCEASVVRLVPREGGRFEVGARFIMMKEAQKANLVQVLSRMGHAFFDDELRGGGPSAEYVPPGSMPELASLPQRSMPEAASAPLGTMPEVASVPIGPAPVKSETIPPSELMPHVESLSSGPESTIPHMMSMPSGPAASQDVKAVSPARRLFLPKKGLYRRDKEGKD